MSNIKAAKVTKVLISHIDPNPHNPRRLFDEEPMHILKESIAKLGILVPITIYPEVDGKTDPIKDRFIILDGERRWRCVDFLGDKKIPAIIVEHPTDIDNILTMFHIHNLREGWQLMPTALKLEVLMRKMGVVSEKKLSVLTKITVGQIRRCKILLSYPRKYQNLMLAPPSKRLKSDFFIELHRIRKPALEEKFPPWNKRGDSKCIEIMLEKYMNKKIEAVTDFRKLAETYRGSVRLKKTKKFYKVFDEFLENISMNIESVIVPGASFERQTREVTRSSNRLEAQISNINLEALASNKRLIESLKNLAELIKKKLEDAMVAKRPEDKE